MALRIGYDIVRTELLTGDESLRIAPRASLTEMERSAVAFIAAQVSVEVQSYGGETK